MAVIDTRLRAANESVGRARLQTIEGIFHKALELESGQLAAFLEEACAGDRSLRHEVEALLASHRQAESFIEKPVVTLDARVSEDVRANTLIGQTIGQYQISKQIGAGGMGAVYLARRADQQYEKLVAIKLVKRGMDTDAVLRHFHTERQILASFDHPNIARLLDGGTENGLPYFVMEYVEGLPIDIFCDTQSLSITRRLELFRQVCGAITYAHRRAVIHRDIKPSNIVVSTDGMPKLLDFGIAKILQPGDSEPVATMTGLRLMTPEYASPEQVRGEPLTTATDVYSLGVVLYQLLTGCLPYRLPRQAPGNIARAISETAPQRPSSVSAAPRAVVAGRGNEECAIRRGETSPERLQRRLRGDLDNIVLMALRKEAERRYQSVEQFSEDIRRHLENLPVLARKDTLIYRGTKFVRRHRPATAAAALALLSLLGGIMATTWEAHRARVQEAIAKAEKARAERRFDDVRKLAHSVLFDYHDAIKDLSGATAVRERLVKDGLVYLDSLAREAGEDPALQRELAAAYERLGDVRGQAFSASLGDIAGAMESYSKSLRIREAMVATSPQGVQSRRDLAKCYVRISNVLIQTNEAARGTDYLRKALEMYLELSAEHPADSEIRYELAGMYNDLGFALEDWWGNWSEALENHRKALSLREGFAGSDPHSLVHRRNLSFTYVNIGRALFQSGDTKGALESNRKGLAIRSALFAENPSNADYRRLLAISYQNDGKYRALLHDLGGALQSFRNKLLLERQLLADDPLNAQELEDFGYSYERIGDLLARSGDYAKALSYYRKALSLYEKVWSIAPRIWRVHYRAIFSRAAIAKMQANLGNKNIALGECSKVTSLLSEIPEVPESRLQSGARGQIYMHLAETYATLGTSGSVAVAERRNHWREARNMYTRALEIWNDMQSRGILTGEYTAKPQEVAREIARCNSFLQR
jgi:serine/threonine protein kinase